ncbi:MAG: HipA domain-containing protein [Scrofimicrobium sp.]
MARRKLSVFLYGKLVGELTGDGTLIQGFRYRSGYVGPILSHSLPTTRRSASRQAASTWFNGLLPEGRELRLAMAQAHDSRNTTPMGLLENAGLDCAGAVQLTPDAELSERLGSFESIDEREIGLRLRAALRGQPVTEFSERWSVAGQQGKLALHRTEDGRWARALDGLPTTHIVKPGIAFVGRDAVEDQALMEHITLAAARAIGIDAALTEFHEFDGVPAVVVQRYDRIRIEGVVQRIHQEDFCQALGVRTENKYEDQGGPGVRQIARMLDEVAGDSSQSFSERVSFARMAIFNYLIGNPDAHAKNYSLLILPDGSTSLAPMYDAASGLGYSVAGTVELRFPRAAMKVGFEDAFFGVTERDWRQFARDLALPYEVVAGERNRIVEELPDALRTVLDEEAPSTARKRILASPLLGRVQENTSTALI